MKSTTEKSLKLEFEKFFTGEVIAQGFLMLNYLLFAGIIRFCIEFLRLNPKYILNLSSAQLVSFFMVSISIILLYRMKNNSLLLITYVCMT